MSSPALNIEAGRPLIGLMSTHERRGAKFSLDSRYAGAVVRAGGAPLVLPLVQDPTVIEVLVEVLDGLLLTGGDDVDPRRFGQEPHPKLETVSPLRDEVEWQLVAEAERRRLAVLGVCRGSQVINVLRGGTLFQDIEAQVDSPVKHFQSSPEDELFHTVRLAPETALAELAGAEQVRVNSFHHQAIDRLGRGLFPVAWTADGLVEAVVDRDPRRFLLAVQWHPERSPGDVFSRRIFEHFVQAAKRATELPAGLASSA